MAALTDEFADLTVTCPNETIGCNWQGFLKDLKEHGGNCEKELMGELVTRVKNIEEKLAQKDREIAFLKNDFAVKVQYVIKEKKIQRNADIEWMKEILAEVKEENRQLKERYERDEEQGKGEVEVMKTNTDDGVREVEEEDVKNQISSADQLSSPMLPTRPFFEIEIDGENIGRIVIDLFSDKAPETCKKFLTLCTDRSGVGYRGSKFHWVSDVTCRAGKDTSRSENFPSELVTPVENLAHKHDTKGIVSMVNEDGVTKAQFFIISQPASDSDGQHVPIGCVSEERWPVVEKISNVQTLAGVPAQQVRISRCGVCT